jgi:hypothetical protein
LEHFEFKNTNKKLQRLVVQLIVERKYFFQHTYLRAVVPKDGKNHGHAKGSHVEFYNYATAS